MTINRSTTTKKVFDYLKSNFKTYNNQEASALAFMVLEELMQINKAEVLANKAIDITQAEENKIAQIIERVNQSEPIQYILGSADFYGRKLMVNKNVLIPRPETEELCHTILQSESALNNLKILDIGTGSGAIAITLAAELKQANVYAVDISDSALSVAKNNAQHLRTSIRFIHADICQTVEWPSIMEDIGLLDVIVSNPPYVRESEKTMMEKNVLDYEPHLALFVPDQDALKFYRVVADFGVRFLKKGGRIYLEINEYLAKETANQLLKKGYAEVQIIKDINGKDRFIKARKI